MEFTMRFLRCSFVILMGLFLGSSHAYKFFVGGKGGWVVNPSECYNHWAERNRFQVNDTLYFKYKKGSDSVLLVSKDDYFSCNTKDPLNSLTGGDSMFQFGHSGPFFFISGTADHCKKGQKLIVVVMALRNKAHHHLVPPSPAPVASPPPASSSPTSPPTAGSPQAESRKGPATTPAPSTQPPQSRGTPLDVDAPAPAPATAKNGALGLGSSVGSVLGYGVAVSVVLGSFSGMV